MGDFAKGLMTGATSAGIVGLIGAVVIGGITALCAGPVGVAAAVGAGLFGLFGACLGAVATGTSPSAGDWRANWVAGLPVTGPLLLSAPMRSALPLRRTTRRPKIRPPYR